MRLAIDTSGVDQAIAVFEGDRLLAAEDWVRQRNDPPVLARVERLVDRAGKHPDELEIVVATRGPGSFTGLRVGLSIAAGLAYARHVPLYLIDSLPVLARRAQGDPAAIALRDAGRGELFAWRANADAQRISAAELAEWLPSTGSIVMEPAGKLADWVPAAANREVTAGQRRPLSAALLDSSIWAIGSQKPLRYDEVQALYVQPAAAEERRRKAT
jgi:tRNA threonylcarbamoyl adenosine modification protein YeaZ